MSMALDGLVSGMNTTELISQLMKAEALPQTALKNKVTTQNKVINAFQTINTKMAGLAAAAKALGSADAWGAMKATSSSDAAVVTARAGASAGSLSFRVEEVATTHTVTFTGKTVDSPTNPMAVDGRSLSEMVAGINAEPTSLYKASAVQIGSGKYTLQLTAKTSGATAAFEDAELPTGLDAAMATTTVQGTDARIRIGEPGSGGDYTIDSATNTFADVLPGLTVTATRKQAATDAPVTVSLTADADAVAAKVQTLVDNLNSVLSEISTQTKGKNGALPAGALSGDSAMRTLRQNLLSSISGGVAGVDPLNPGNTGSFADIGVQLTRDGSVTFDKDKFLAELAKDPAKTQRYFDSYTEVDSKTAAAPGGLGTEGKFQPDFDVARGLGRKLETIALLATEGVTRPGDPVGKIKEGTLQGQIQRRNDTIRDLNNQVSNWDDRLSMRRAGLERQFSSMEAALGKMQQQSSWLSSQLASLG